MEFVSVLTDPLVILSARIAIALLFLVAVVSKLRHYSVFRATILDYQLAPKPLVGIVAISVITLEASVVLGSLSLSYSSIAMQIAMYLVLFYGVAIAINLIRGRRDIDCGCTGPAVRQSLSGWLVLRNAGLAGVAWLGSLVAVNRSLSVLDYGLVVLVVVAGATVYAVINQLMANVPSLDALDSLMEIS